MYQRREQLLTFTTISVNSRDIVLVRVESHPSTEMKSSRSVTQVHDRRIANSGYLRAYSG